MRTCPVACADQCVCAVSRPSRGLPRRTPRLGLARRARAEPYRKRESLPRSLKEDEILTSRAQALVGRAVCALERSLERRGVARHATRARVPRSPRVRRLRADTPLRVARRARLGRVGRRRRRGGARHAPPRASERRRLFGEGDSASDACLGRNAALTKAREKILAGYRACTATSSSSSAALFCPTNEVVEDALAYLLVERGTEVSRLAQASAFARFSSKGHADRRVVRFVSPPQARFTFSQASLWETEAELGAHAARLTTVRLAPPNSKASPLSLLFTFVTGSGARQGAVPRRAGPARLRAALASRQRRRGRREARRRLAEMQATAARTCLVLFCLALSDSFVRCMSPRFGGGAERRRRQGARARREVPLAGRRRKRADGRTRTRLGLGFFVVRGTNSYDTRHCVVFPFLLCVPRSIGNAGRREKALAKALHAVFADLNADTPI